jgi:hypothetical protein
MPHSSKSSCKSILTGHRRCLCCLRSRFNPSKSSPPALEHHRYSPLILPHDLQIRRVEQDRRGV